LDRKIKLWDLTGAGQKLSIEVGDEEKSDKGSVYALSATRNMIASGGPESIVRLWDPRSGKRITKFVGHTDNVRSILINECSDTIMTASSDQTIKVWSVTAGRCIHTLTMHSDSVWSLYSDDPQLGIFYSSDRSGLIVKTDVRGTLGEMDDGLSLAIAQEHHGVSKVVACGGHIWTATASSSINRWTDVDTGADIELPVRHHRASSAASRPSYVGSPPVAGSRPNLKKIPLRSLLRISNTAAFPALREPDPEAATLHSITTIGRKGSDLLDQDVLTLETINHAPEETIEGQHGLVKHKLLNDRRRVLTVDTAGDVLLWDLLKCVPIQSFGKRHLEDVEPEVNNKEAVAPWCSISSTTGRLAVVLEEYNCFDAEMYADQVDTGGEKIEFREDQRINLGKWVLRYIFENLIDELIRRDEALRAEIKLAAAVASPRAQPPTGLQMPPPTFSLPEGGSTATTPRGNGATVQMTPGLGIGVATPAPIPQPSLPGVPEEQMPNIDSNLEKLDYFNSTPIPSTQAPATPVIPPLTPGTLESAVVPSSPLLDAEKVNGKEGGIFGKKFKMNMSFGTKKLGRSPSTAAEVKPTVVEPAVSEDSEASGEPTEKEPDTTMTGVLQQIKAEYEKSLQEAPEKELESGICPSGPTETPVLKIPPGTTVIVQEDTSGGSADLYRGTVASVGQDADLIVKVAPFWLGDLLLRNSVPPKEPVKISFVLQPWGDELPSIAGPDGNCRLNANRMLRVKKILAYVAERIDPLAEKAEDGAMRPEEYLDLYCYDKVRPDVRLLWDQIRTMLTSSQKLPITMTLATLRTHVWKGGADVMLYYKANGKRIIGWKKEDQEEEAEEAPPGSAA
jgi:WD repeat-containing protein 48